MISGVDKELLKWLFEYIIGFFDYNIKDDELDDRWMWVCRMFEREERRWRQQKKTPKKIKELFIQDKVISKEESKQLRINYLKEQYEDSLRRYYQKQASIKEVEGRKKQLLYFMNPPKDKITDEDIKIAKNRNISDFIEVSRGKQIKCIFHNDNNPSLGITRNMFHCFSCGVGGDTISFVMKLKNLKFIEAVRFIINN